MAISRNDISTSFHALLFDKVSIAPLITFRVLFGLMMVVSIVRFAANGWITELYVKPNFFFTYYGFDWVHPFGELGMSLWYGGMLLAALGIMFGCFYRWSAMLFFCLFTYVELIDKTYYLNHYYFVSLVSALLIFVPAHRAFSIDAWRKPKLTTKQTAAWTINVFKLQLGIVYFFAGLAKLHPDWLFEAMPLKLWLPSVSETPLIGFLFNYEWSAYVFSWTGAIYDLTIVFFLLYAPTRILAYLAVIAFHMMTAMLFQIGMFPYIMMGLTLIYFSPTFHEKLLRFLGWKKEGKSSSTKNRNLFLRPVTTASLLTAFFLFQFLLPLRFLAYPGALYWTEQGYRFSWRVMLMEKGGHTTFTVKELDGSKTEWVNNYDYLTPHQEKMMSTQPDMILQFAHHLQEIYQQKGYREPIVQCNSKVSLNGRRSRTFVDPQVDLAKEKRGFHHKNWIMPFDAH